MVALEIPTPPCVPKVLLSRTARARAHTHTHTCTLTHTHTHTCTHTLTPLYTLTHAHMHACTPPPLSLTPHLHPPLPPPQVNSRICSLAWTADGAFLALGCFDGSIGIRDKGGAEKIKIDAATAPVWTLSWNPTVRERGGHGCVWRGGLGARDPR